MESPSYMNFTPYLTRKRQISTKEFLEIKKRGSVTGADTFKSLIFDFESEFGNFYGGSFGVIDGEDMLLNTIVKLPLDEDRKHVTICIPVAMTLEMAQVLLESVRTLWTLLRTDRDGNVGAECVHVFEVTGAKKMGPNLEIDADSGRFVGPKAGEINMLINLIANLFRSQPFPISLHTTLKPGQVNKPVGRRMNILTPRVNTNRPPPHDGSWLTRFYAISDAAF